MEMSIMTTTCRISTPDFFLSGSVRPKGNPCGTFGVVGARAPQHVRPQDKCVSWTLCGLDTAGLGMGRNYGIAIDTNDSSFDLEPLGVAV